MDKVKNFCDHSIILREMAANRKPGERWRSLDASIFIQTQQTVPHMKADIFS